MSKFVERLAQPGVLVADGATGTMLQKAGLPRGMAPERWNLENPDAICSLHRSYIDAGANVILTNTFGATRHRLERDGLAEQVVEINRTAALLGRKAAGSEVLVLGDIGPSGKLLKPLGPLTYEQAVQAFTEQAAGLVEGGVDAILIETMSDLKEVRAAVEAVRSVTSLPLLVTLSFDTRGHTMMGVKPAQAAAELLTLEVQVIGANCGRTLTETLAAIEEMRKAAPGSVLMAKPNAGLPRLAGSTGQTGERKDTNSVYDVSPEVMAEYALRFLDFGVKIFGGCCGSNPDHIRAVAGVLQGR